MDNYVFREDKCYAVGDTHSTKVLYDIFLHKIPDNSDVVFLGDYGIGFGSDIYVIPRALAELKSLNNLCVRKNIICYLLRGNHDAVYDEIWRSEWTNIYLIKDSGYAIFPNNKKVLFVGGGLSVDRCTRTNGVDYWVEEPTPILRDLKKCDIMFSHDCPEYFNHATSSLYQRFQWALDRDSLLIDDCNAQRINMSNIVKDSGVSHVFYGHMHNNMVETHNGIYGRCININEVFEFDSNKEYKL